MGALCAVSLQPRTWSSHDIHLLTALAALAMAELTLIDVARGRTTPVGLLEAKSGSRTTEDPVSGEIHDLRVPLNNILLGLQSLTVAGPVNEEQTEILESSLRTGRRLSALLSEMLTDKAAESSAYSDARQVAMEAVKEAERSARGKGQTIALACMVADGCVIHGKRAHLRRALVSILCNAVKFTPEGGHITLTLRRGPEFVEFITLDSGIGSAGRVPHPGGDVSQQASPRATHEEHGIGLSFVKQVAVASCGSVTVESRPGGGTRLVLAMPLLKQ